MKLTYHNKREEKEIISGIPDCNLVLSKKGSDDNFIIHGDNLIALKHLLEDYQGKIDLIYIDPPFATNNTFTFSEGRANTISNIKNGEVAYKDVLKGSLFIEFLKERLILLRELLSSKGTIYLHIDYKIGHYVKVMMDEVFGIENFRNDITRIKCNPKNFSRKGYGNIKDLILFYSKGNDIIWNEPKLPYTGDDVEKLFPKIDKDGRRYATIPLHAPGETKNGKTSLPFKGIKPPVGRHWRSAVEILEGWDAEGLIEWSSTGNPRKKIYANEQEGKRMQDIWEFKDPQYPIYPTEKNPNLLDFIIETSSNPHSIVLDCFCGSGTTLKAAQVKGRKWIGIDASDGAIRASTEKLTGGGGDLFENSFCVYELKMPNHQLVI